MSEFIGQSYDNDFRNPRTLEVADLKPLRPTKISRAAQNKLEAWGVTPKQVEDVRSFTSQFRYDLCLKKVVRLSKEPAEVYSREKKDYINLPFYYATDDRLDGQCRDIGNQWIIKINESQLIKKLNQGNGKQIVTAHYIGLSETHFCNERSGHIWNGLALIDQDNNIIDEIYFDAAFQNIHTKEETKYRQKTAAFDIRGVESTENVEVPVGWIEEEGENCGADVPGTVVLGVSSDHLYAYSLGFLRDKKTDVIRPLICRMSENGDKNHYIIGNKDQILDPKKAITSPQYEKEIESMLREVSKLSFIEKPPTENRITWVRKSDIIAHSL